MVQNNFVPLDFHKSHCAPACIMKGVNKESEYEDGMPPGS